MTYTPNINDPRVLRRCKSALEFVELYLKKDQVRPVAKTQILKYFGNTDRSGPGRWLKTLLLTCVDDYHNPLTHQCKKYSKNTQGIQELKTLLGHTQEFEVKESILDELESGQINYIEKADRLYHPLQNYPKRIKRTTLRQNNYNYEYDIQSAAQTLIVQHAVSLGYTKPMPCLTALIEDRLLVREQLSKELNLSKDCIKQCLHAILNGGVISTWHTSAIFSYVNYNTLMIKQLKAHPWIQAYQQEVRDIWKTIRSSMNLNKGQRLNSKKKSEIYRELESQVRKAIQRYLKKTKSRYFFEHDGWTCERVIDRDDLIRYVRKHTGFMIKIDWIIYE